MSEKFIVGDRVRVKPEVVERWRKDPGIADQIDIPLYGHVANFGQSLVWVRDHLGGEWGLPANELEFID